MARAYQLQRVLPIPGLLLLAVLLLNVHGIKPKGQSAYFILISLNTKVALKLSGKFQPNIPIHSGEKADLNGFALLVSAAIVNSQPC